MRGPITMPISPGLPVYDDYGRDIGGVSQEGSGWRSLALDRAANRSDAEIPVRLDWRLGRPWNRARANAIGRCAAA